MAHDGVHPLPPVEHTADGLDPAAQAVDVGHPHDGLLGDGEPRLDQRLHAGPGPAVRAVACAHDGHAPPAGLVQVGRHEQALSRGRAGDAGHARGSVVGQQDDGGRAGVVARRLRQQVGAGPAGGIDPPRGEDEGVAPAAPGSRQQGALGVDLAAGELEDHLDLAGGAHERLGEVGVDGLLEGGHRQCDGAVAPRP